MLQRKTLQLPHRICKSTCFSNGLEDILAWNGAQYPDYLLPVIGGMGEFSYFHFKNASPPHMVYWGANTKYLMQDLGNMIGFHQKIIENRSFDFTFQKMKEYIVHEKPVILGALDMFYLSYYPAIYRKRHIPIHYALMVGYDDSLETVFVHDCGLGEVQSVSYKDLELSMNVHIPGMSKKNTIRIVDVPDHIPDAYNCAKTGMKYRAERMLNPPVPMFGIPAMRKLSKEIIQWTDTSSFEHMVMYATEPPELPVSFKRSHGMRFWKMQVLLELGRTYHETRWESASTLFKESGALIIELCKAAMKTDKEKISLYLARIADIEEEAYRVFV